MLSTRSAQYTPGDDQSGPNEACGSSEREIRPSLIGASGSCTLGVIKIYISVTLGAMKIAQGHTHCD